MHILVTRPAADAETLKRPLEAMGHRVSLAPMLKVRFDGCDAIDADGCAAIIATSRNGLRGLELALKGQSSHALQLPLFVVGPGTAAVARALGFTRVIEGPGTAAGLGYVVAATLQPGAGPLLHVSGDHTAFDLKGALEGQGFRVLQPIVYRSVASTAFPAGVKDDLAQGRIDTVILMSPRAATTFVQLASGHGLGLAARQACYLCLSDAVAAKLEAWSPLLVKIAEKPNLDEILKLVTERPQSFR